MAASESVLLFVLRCFRSDSLDAGFQLTMCGVDIECDAVYRVSGAMNSEDSSPYGAVCCLISISIFWPYFGAILPYLSVI